MKNMVSLARLGQEYNPALKQDGARKMMKRMIDNTPGLKESLSAVGFDGRKVTPKIRKVFYEYLGEV